MFNLDDDTGATDLEMSGQEKISSRAQFKTDSKFINDHHLDKDDRKPLTKQQFGMMDRYQQFEHKFPFYLMDVNGYIMHIKEAMKISHPDANYQDIKTVTL